MALTSTPGLLQAIWQVEAAVYHKRALAHDRAWHAVLPHDELAYLPVGTDDFVGY